MNLGIEPSMVSATSATRRAKAHMADARAMAEQNERENPVNPKGQLMRPHLGVRGSGATPSMGLSQYRGGYGNNQDGTIHTMEVRPMDMLIDGMKKKRGKGTKKGQPRKTARKAYEPESEAYLMGRELSRHITGLHGGAFHREFLHGLSGGAWYDFLDPNKNGIGNAFNTVKNEVVNPDSGLRRGLDTAGQAVAGQFTDPNSVLRGQVIPIGAQVAQYASPFIDSVVPGAGTALNYGMKGLNYANKGAQMLGYGDSEMARASQMLGQKKKGRNRNNGVPLLSGNVDGAMSGGSNTGQYEGHGRVVGAGKRPNARAVLVKKVMAEHGMSMIEASKYIKKNGLYGSGSNC